MNILLLTIDALRYDVLALETEDRSELPNITALLGESVWFTRAFSPASGTDVSLSTLLTGRADPFQQVEWTLPEALANVGRKTTSALPVEVDRYVGETLLDRGFARAKPIYTDWGTSDVGDHVSAPSTTWEGIRAIREDAAGPWFVWLHYFDAHEHHQIPQAKKFRERVGAEGGEARQKYRALLLAIDTEIGRLRAELTTLGLADNTIIVFASDHGESLGDDPRLGPTHGKVVYPQLVHIPFALHVPGIAPGVRTDPVSLMDLAPTLLSLLGVPDAMGKLDGIDLVPALLDGPAALRPPANRPLAQHEEQQWGVIEWPLQLIVRPADDVTELYDLAADPRATTDLAEKRPEDVRRLRARYATELTPVRVDRTLDGRRRRERLALPPPNRVPPAGAAATSTP